MFSKLKSWFNRIVFRTRDNESDEQRLIESEDQIDTVDTEGIINVGQESPVIPRSNPLRMPKTEKRHPNASRNAAWYSSQCLEHYIPKEIADSSPPVVLLWYNTNLQSFNQPIKHRYIGYTIKPTT